MPDHDLRPQRAGVVKTQDQQGAFVRGEGAARPSSGCVEEREREREGERACAPAKEKKAAGARSRAGCGGTNPHLLPGREREREKAEPTLPDPPPAVSFYSQKARSAFVSTLDRDKFDRYPDSEAAPTKGRIQGSRNAEGPTA